MKREILRAYSWDRCLLMTSRKLFLIEIISNLQSKGKRHKKRPTWWSSKWDLPVPQVMRATTLIRIHPTRWCPNHNRIPQVSSKWIAFSTFNMSASKPNWRKNMIKESTSFTNVSRKDSHNKGHTKMHTWSLCRIAWARSTSKRRIRLTAVPNLEHRRTITHKNFSYQAWKITIWEAIIEKIYDRTKGVWNPKTKIFPAVCKSKRKSNTIDSISIALRKPLKWWESSTSQHPLWD